MLSYTYVYLHTPADNLQLAGKIDYYFVFSRLEETPSLDPESVALSTELQARLSGIILHHPQANVKPPSGHNLVTNDSDFIRLHLLTYLR